MWIWVVGEAIGSGLGWYRPERWIIILFLPLA